MPRSALAAAGLTALAACTGLQNPDIEHGALSGRLLNATTAAYVYPLGRPDLVVRPAADGRYVLAEVPVETTDLVVVDGGSPAWRAALLPVAVQAAGQAAAPDLDAGAMALAGSIGVVARLGGGATSTGTRFTVSGTDLLDVVPAGPGAAVVLRPLPAGTFDLAAAAEGFVEAHIAITVTAGATTPYEVPLAVDGLAFSPGCGAPGAGCRTGLVCDGGDGTCHECVSDANCPQGSGARSACLDRACRVPGAPRETCDPCVSDSDCASDRCAVNGAYCTRSCAVDADCPAGLACQPDGPGLACKAPAGCDAAKGTFGAACFFATGCAGDLGRCTCSGASPAASPPAPGYATGPCATPEDCSLAPGWACTSGACTRP